MTMSRIMSAGVVALAIVSSAASAQQTRNGTITGINRLNGTISIGQTQTGTVGSGAGTASEEFKVQSGVSLETLHAGDRVSFSASDTDGTKTITKIDRQ